MDDLARLMAERDCLRLMTAYCTHLDAWEVDRFLDLFTAEGAWRRTAPLPQINLEGREAIRGFFQRRPTHSYSRHLILNPVVDILDEASARGVCVGLVVRGPAAPAFPVPMRGVELIVEYRHSFARTTAGWRIAEIQMDRLIDVEATPKEA